MSFGAQTFTRDPRVWTPTGQQRDEVVRRLQASEKPDDISFAVGMSRLVGKRKCREITAARGIPGPRKQRAAFCQQVCALADEGA